MSYDRADVERRAMLKKKNRLWQNIPETPRDRVQDNYRQVDDARENHGYPPRNFNVKRKLEKKGE